MTVRTGRRLTYYREHIAGQYQAGGGLTYDAVASPARLYYRGANGYLVYFIVNSIWDYYYVACPGNFQLYDQSLKIVGDLAIYHYGDKSIIYYVARYLPLDDDLIHCMVQEPDGSWNTNSPSYEAAASGSPVGSQIRSDPAGNIAVSPDGNTIAYFGKAPSPFIFYFSYIDGLNYSYHSIVLSGLAIGDNSLQFTDANYMYYISSWYDGRVHRLTIQENYCANSIISKYE